MGDPLINIISGAYASAKYNLLLKKVSEECEPYLKLSPEIATLKRLESIVSAVYSDSSSNDRVKGIIASECTCQSEKSRPDESLKFNAPGSCVLLFLKAFLASGGLQYVPSTLRQGDEKIIPWLMKLAWKIHVSKNNLPKCKGSLQDKVASFAPKMLEWDNYSMPNLRARKQISQPEMVTFFEIIVNDIRLPNSKAKTELMGASINEFQIIPSIFTTFENLTAAAAVTMLESITVLTLKTEENIEILFRNEGWQNWCIPYLLLGRNESIIEKRLDTLDPDLEKKIFKFAVNTFSLLHYHGLTKMKKGFKTLLEESRKLLSEKIGWTEEPVAIYRILLFTLFKRVQTAVSAPHMGYTQVQWDNLFKLLDATENFLFFEPTEESNGGKKKRNDKKKRVGLHLYEDGSSQDVIISTDIVELFERKIKYDQFDPRLAKEAQSNPKVQELGKRLSKEKDYFQLVHKFLSGLEKASGSDKEEMVKVLPNILKSRKTGKSEVTSGISSALDRELAVAVEKARVTLSSDGGDSVTVNTMTNEQILASAKRKFSNASAAAKFCLEKKQQIFLDASFVDLAGTKSQRGSDASNSRRSTQVVPEDKKIVNAPVEIQQIEPVTEAKKEEISQPETELKFDSEKKVQVDVNNEEEFVGPPKWALVEQNYEAQASNELSITKGTVLEILQVRENAAWLVSGNGKVGYCLPQNFKIMSEERILALLNERAIESKYDEDSGSDEEDFNVDNDADLELLQEQLIYKKRDSLPKSDEKIDLRCGYCKLPLSSEDFYELNGVVCCKDDLLKNFLKCNACGEPIMGEHVNLTSQRLHPKCATCTICSKSMKNIAHIHERGGKLYCRKHYDELFGKVCGHCNQQIYANSVSALGKHWHPDHFFCAGSCGKVLDQDYLVSEGKAYCAEDFKKELGRKCKKCDQIITTNAINVGDYFYHQSCVICARCETPFLTGLSYFPEPLRPNETYHRFLCSKDYREKYLRPCARCHLVIVSSEERTVVDDVVYHIQCIKCEECGASLAGKEVFFDNSNPPRMICTADFERLVQNKCALCNLGLEAGKIVVISGMKCHKQCVKCTTCSVNLLEYGGGVHKSKKDPSKLLCKDHFIEETNTKCTACEQFIVSGGIVTIMGKKFHKTCVVCEACKVDLNGQRVLLIRNKPRCKLHLKP